VIEGEGAVSLGEETGRDLIASFCKARPVPEPAISQADLLQLGDAAEREVRGNILPFWLEHVPDRVRGGFHGLITETMGVLPDEPRGALLTSRILWTFARAHREWGEPEHLEMARAAHADLISRFKDDRHGGFHWAVSPDGRPLPIRKQVYGQAFACFGLSELVRATGDEEALAEAVAVHRFVEARAADRRHGGYVDALTPRWRRKGGSVFGSAPKSQNTHLHVLEAYTNLLRVWPDDRLRARVLALIDVILDHLLDRESNHLVQLTNDDWTPLSTGVSCGHDIELSWLLGEAAEVLEDESALERVPPIALAIADATLRDGVDVDGGVVNAGTVSAPADPSKDWWPQAEAVIGFLDAYARSLDPRYFEAARRSWEFIDRFLVDREHGDWHQSVTREGVPRPLPKVSFWKCPYHSARCCFEVAERTRLIAAAM